MKIKYIYSKSTGDYARILNETEKKEALNLIKNLKESKDFKNLINKEKELKTELDEIDKLEKDSNYQKLHFQEIIGKIESDFNALSNKVYSLYPNEKDLERQFEVDLKREDSYSLVRKAILLSDQIPELKTKLNSIKNELKTKLNNTRELLKKDLATIKELKAKYPNSKFEEIEKTIETILSGDNLEKMVLSSRDYNKNSDLAALVSDFKKLASDISLQLKEKENIIKRQLELIDSSMPAYPKQIKKALKRKDFVSINHRIAEFLASYFDLLFAINEVTHPGEKRLIQLCKKKCKILPENFEEDLNLLFLYMFSDKKQDSFIEVLDRIVNNIKNIAKIKTFD